MCNSKVLMSALSEERTYPYKVYHPEIEVPPKGKHSQTF